MITAGNDEPLFSLGDVALMISLNVDDFFSNCTDVSQIEMLVAQSAIY